MYIKSAAFIVHIWLMVGYSIVQLSKVLITYNCTFPKDFFIFCSFVMSPTNTISSSPPPQIWYFIHLIRWACKPLTSSHYLLLQLCSLSSVCTQNIFIIKLSQAAIVIIIIFMCALRWWDIILIIIISTTTEWYDENQHITCVSSKFNRDMRLRWIWTHVERNTYWEVYGIRKKTYQTLTFFYPFDYHFTTVIIYTMKKVKLIISSKVDYYDDGSSLVIIFVYITGVKGVKFLLFVTS